MHRPHERIPAPDIAAALAWGRLVLGCDLDDVSHGPMRQSARVVCADVELRGPKGHCGAENAPPA